MEMKEFMVRRKQLLSIIDTLEKDLQELEERRDIVINHIKIMNLLLKELEDEMYMRRK